MTAFGRWLPAVARTSFVRRSALGAVCLVFVGGAAGPAANAAHAAPTPTAALSMPAKDNGDGGAPGQSDDKQDQPDAKPGPPWAKELGYRYQRQPNFFYCGPAATRMALTARGHAPSQDEVAGLLGTTVNGTNSAEDTTRVLNSVDGTNFYRTTAIPEQAATPAEMDRLQADVVRAISAGYPVVANIIGTAADIDGGVYSYPGGHYLTVISYTDEGRLIKIADPANLAGDGTYWMTTITLAHWIASRGYSS
jgi:hypothetical protein